jgi:hypothetical protein
MRPYQLAVVLGVCVTASFAKGDSSQELWQGFRKAHPFHLQAVGLSEPREDGSRTLIVSEPPPHATPEGLIRCSPKLPASLVVKEHRIGHDGFVRDVVVDLPRLSGPEAAELVDRLHNYLFGTTYKAEAIRLPLGPAPPPGKLPGAVSAEDLRAWAFDKDESFAPIEGGLAQPLRAILADKRSGVFLSKSRGLVVWALPRGADVERHWARARQFCVDSDLILGAVADDNHLALIGRERVAPVRALPPLRVETLDLLAKAGTGHLAQSYERNALFAGRYDKEWDWAPIYLSPALVDTEYGSLLNITDQLLKRWSANGKVEYEEFKYPDPQPFAFKRPLILEIKSGSLTYNWNTAGAGYTVDRAGVEVYGLNRFGALPVSYIPGGAATTEGREEVAGYEDTAYRWFTGLGDPNLVRVTQYAAVYQIFRKFGRSDAKSPAPTAGQVQASKVLAKYASRALDEFRKGEPGDVVDRVTAAEDQPSLPKAGVLTRVVAVRSMLEKIEKAFGAAGLTAFADAMANPRRFAPDELKDLETKARPVLLKKDPDVLRDSEAARNLVSVLAARDVLSDPRNRFVLARFVRLATVRDEYAKAMQGTPAGWIRTPSVVVSRGTGELAEYIGGHNLDARVTEFKFSDDIMRGKVDVVRSKDKVIITFNPADAAKAPGLVRRAGREADNPNLKDLLERDLLEATTPKVAPRDETVYPGGMPKAEAGGGGNGRGYDRGPPPGGPPRDGPPAGWDPLGIPGERRTGPAVRVQKIGDYFLIETANGERYRAASPVSLSEFLVRKRFTLPEGQRLEIDFVNLTPNEVRNVLKTAELRAAADGGGGSRKPPGGFPPDIEQLPPGGDGSFVGRINTKGITKAQYKQMLAEHDLTRVNVHEPEVREIKSGPRQGQVEVTITVELPAKMADRPSLFFRVRMYFAKWTGDLKARVAALVGKKLATPPDDPGDLAVVASDLKAELKDIGVDVELDYYRDQIIDGVYTDNRRDTRDAPRQRAADLAG